MFDGTPFLRVHARRRRAALAAQDVAAVQRRQLMDLLRRARDTRFGRAHDFATIDGVEAFQARVPLRRYEDFWEGYWREAFPVLDGQTWPGPIPYFAKSSGTSSGTSKYIPVTREILAGNRRGVLDMLAFHLQARPDSRVLGGKNFMLGGSTALNELSPGVRAGDVSGIAAREIPFWARPYYFPPAALAEISDWDEKMAALAPRSLNEDIRCIGGTASWLLLFLQQVMALRQGGLSDCYPHLELIVYGGVNFAPYRHQYESLVAGTAVDLREVYPASEGFLASADRGVGEGLRLLADAGIFYEFVPVDELGGDKPRRFWLGTIETGVNYAVVMSTPAGLFAYVLGDTVRFVERDPPRLLVSGRVSTSLSAFGEHLIEEEIVQAVTAAGEAIAADVADFTIGPVFPSGEERRGRHRVIVEFAEDGVDAEAVERFGAVLDERLRAVNEDYREYRNGDRRIMAPEVVAVPPGTFAEWMKARGRLGGQNKVPRVTTDAEALAELSRPSRS